MTAPMISVTGPISDYCGGVVNAAALYCGYAITESANGRKRGRSRACGFRNRGRFRTAIKSRLEQLDLFPSAAHWAQATRSGRRQAFIG
jgi:hypothetical protein